MDYLNLSQARMLLRIAGEQFQGRLPVKTQVPQFVGPAAAEELAEWLKCGREDSIPAHTPYTGNIEAGTFRSESDPHPHLDVVIQVCISLKRMGRPYPELFWHVFVMGLSPTVFRFNSSKMLEDMVAQLAMDVGHWDNASIVARAVAEWRRNRLETVRRQRMDQQRRRRLRLKGQVLCETERNMGENALNIELEPSAIAA
jgi:hypothetical protein